MRLFDASLRRVLSGITHLCFVGQLKCDLIAMLCRDALQVVEDGYEFFAKRQLVTIFSAPNYCGEFDNAGAMMSVDDTLMCSFQILKPAEKKQRISQAGEGELSLSVIGVGVARCSL
jgi:hypothetical protein